MRGRSWFLTWPARSDLLLALLFAGTVLATQAGQRWTPVTAALTVSLVVLLTVPLVLRRRYPYLMLVVLFAVGLLPGPDLIKFAAILVASYSAGAYSDRGLLAPATVVCYGLLIGITGAPASRGLGVAVLAAWLIGYREQWQRKLQAHEAAKRVAAAEERARIARELHDVVAHSVSVMVVQAEAGRRLVGRDPGATLNALQSISAAGREAMGELRHILGVLNPADGKPLAAPQPGLGDVDALVQRVREAGLAVELRIEGTPHTLPPGLAVTAYRIVQEALTNAVKHSDGGPAEVVIRYGESDLTLEVTNEGWTARRPSPPENGGRGLLGMQERVAAYGGDLEVGPRPGNSYAVRARLPLAS